MGEEAVEQSEKNTKTPARMKIKNSKQIKTPRPREQDSVETENTTGNGHLNHKVPRMRLFKNNRSSRNVISTEEEDPNDLEIQPYDELFFCYVCKSIFVSKQAL